MSLKSHLVVIGVTGMLSLAMSPAAMAEHIWGTSSATPMLDLGWGNSWEYRLEVQWDTSEIRASEIGPVTFFVDSGDCLCCRDCFAFADTAGIGTGEGGYDTYFFGEVLCEGDPVLFGGDPTLRFERYEEREPARAGFVILRFRSMREPTREEIFRDAIGMRLGGIKSTGDITGVLPSCEAALTPVRASSWSGVKTSFK